MIENSVLQSHLKSLEKKILVKKKTSETIHEKVYLILIVFSEL